MPQSASRRGFSLIELVIVVVIIGVLAAIAIPRLSRGAASAGEAALTADLRILRSAIDTYATEHGGEYPTGPEQLLKFTDVNGNISETKTGEFVFGPYLRAAPPLPVGEKKGAAKMDVVANEDDPAVGWIYDPSNGTVRANTKVTEVDAKGKPFRDY